MSRPVIAIDAGNTNTVVGVFQGEALVHDIRLATNVERTADEYGALLLPLLHHAGFSPQSSGVVISSVVPPLNPILEGLARRFFGCAPLFVEPGVKTGLSIRFDHPAEVGADRIVNAVAARHIYGSPAVVVDFGTATTFDVINAAGEYVGGIIAPGLAISAEALFSQASRLYRIDIRRPPSLLGTNTVHAMQSGIYFGYLGLVDGILGRLRGELGGRSRIIATGGQAALLAEGSEYIEHIDPQLTLVGLKLIHDRNRRI